MGVHVALDARLADFSPGGIATYSLRLAAALKKLSTTRLTLLRSARPRLTEPAQPDLTERRILTPPHHRFERLTLALEVARLRPGVLHSPDFIPPLKLGWRSVITVHDLGFAYFPETLTAESLHYYGQIERAVREADAIVAVSQHTRSDLIRLVGAEASKIKVILEAADERFHPVSDPSELERARRRLGVQRPFILFVGSLEPRKNLLRLLDAFARLRREVDVELVLVGRTGWLYQPILERLARPDVQGWARLFQDVETDELPAIYSAATVLALPSLYEGFGLTALEAMACGCPVVGSNRAALPEVVGEAGLLVEAEDVEALAEALLRVLTNGGLQADLARLGLERAGQFSWQRAAAETQALYQRVAS